MERETRFELATSTLATWGSTTELLPHIWCWRRDLNPQPTVYKTVALPIELRQLSGWGSRARTYNGRGNNPVRLPVAPHPNKRLFRHGLGKSTTSAYVWVGQPPSAYKASRIALCIKHQCSIFSRNAGAPAR